jgi:hypothetical protein
MIANIDENLGRFREKLTELGLSENTLLIYMTDNGTAAGWIDEDARYPYNNAGMRGWKSSAYDGGHRVPCYWHWPKGGLTGGRDISMLTAHIDILPTLVDMLGLKKPDGPAVDGIPLTAPLQGVVEEAQPDRTLFVHVQRQHVPPKWVNSSVMTKRWRMIDGKELYDIAADPGQKTDIAQDHPDVIETLKGKYETWWKSLAPAMDRTIRIGLGGAENPMTLSSHDWLMQGGDEGAAWHQKHVQRGDLIIGPWAVDVKKPGTYRISLHRWPPYLNKAMNMAEARLQIGGFDQTMSLNEEATEASFTVNLKAGPAMLQTWLTRPDGKQLSAYFTQVRLLPEAENNSK